MVKGEWLREFGDDEPPVEGKSPVKDAPSLANWRDIAD
jgi:hypothetical protein